MGVRAFRVLCERIDGEGIVFAESAGRARYSAYLSAKEADFDISLPEFKVKRAPSYDCRLDISGKIAAIGFCFCPEYLRVAP